MACYRITRLLTADVILDGPRDWLVRAAYAAQGRAAVEQPVPDFPGAWSEVARSDENPPKLATLVTCRWCTGVWVAGGVTAARVCWPRGWQRVAEGCVLATVAVLLARAEDG